MQKGPERELKFAESMDRMLNSLQQIERQTGSIENAGGEGPGDLHQDERSQYLSNVETKVVRALGEQDKVYEAVIERLFRPGPTPVSEEWRSAVSRGWEEVFHSGVLNSLVSEVPDEIHRREEAIPKPFQDTFSWIFEEQSLWRDEDNGPFSVDFPAWLESDSKSPFWITGKPGSGKSTLMKFIAHAPELQEHLTKWAGDVPLQMASFYAWIAGTELQHSAAGFMRTVLWQCIQSSGCHSDLDSNLAFAVAPRRWALFATLRNLNKQPPWEDWELKESFDLLLTEIVKKKRVIFFIDGLDEFNLLPAETLELIQGLWVRDGVKVCIASRPWVEFNDGLDSFPMLRVQDLTKNDIKRFVENSLNNNRGFKEQKEVFPEQVNALVQEIVEKANGVFLWAHFVVGDLLGGFTQGDNLKKLAQTLRDLPEDIYKLYSRIWRGIGARKSDFARLVALRRAAFEGPSYLALWFADVGNSEDLDIRNLSTARLRNLRLQVVRRLDTATRGILELSRLNRVDFLHRTTLDWIVQDEVWEDISSQLDPDFNPNLSLLQAEAQAYMVLAHRAFNSGNQRHVSHEPAQVFRYAHRIGESQTDKENAVQVLENFQKDILSFEERIRALREEPSASEEEPSTSGDESRASGEKPRPSKIEPRGCGKRSRATGGEPRDRARQSHAKVWTDRHTPEFSDYLNLMCCHCATPYLEAKIPIAKPHVPESSPVHNGAPALELAVFGGRGASAGRDWIPLHVRKATVKLLLDRGVPERSCEAVRLQVMQRKDSALNTSTMWQYWGEIIALLSAELEKMRAEEVEAEKMQCEKMEGVKRGKISRFVARLLRDKPRSEK